jgi:sugar transferase (PEP-CTERM/EpsH1 system associated)
MKILAIWHDLPSPYTGSSLPAFNLLKYLTQKHDVTLLCFKDVEEESRYNYDLNQYCEVVEPESITVPKSSLERILQNPADSLSPKNLFFANFRFMNFYYSSRMQRRINNLLSTRKFDLIYSSHLMTWYVLDVDLPKVVHEFDCVTEQSRQKYLLTKNLAMKFRWWLAYLAMKRAERNIFNNFDACIVVSPNEQKTLKSLFPKAKALVVPNGVDSEFFSPKYEQEEYPSLIFVGDMSYYPNVDAMLYFCSQIYEKIKNNLPETKLYIVGRNPANEIQRLSSDKSIIVTGYVEDVRPYLARASVVLAPFVSGTPGIKNKVLEAMAMAKPVVSTPIGTQGITMASSEHVIVAKEPDEFASHVVKLLYDEQLRQKIGHNARELVESSYSWETMAKQLDKIFTEEVDKYNSRKKIC